MARPKTVEMTSNFIPLVLTHVSRMKGDVEALRKRFSLPELSLDAAMNLPLPVHVEVCESAARMLKDPFLGLTIAQNTPRGFYGVMEFAARSAPNLGEALHRLVRYQRFVNPSVTISQLDESCFTTVEHQIEGEPLASGRHGNEFTIAMIVRLSREVTNTEIIPRRVYFAHPAPRDTSKLMEFFGRGCEIEFERRVNGLVIDSEHCSLEVISADGELLRMLDRIAGQLLPQAPTATTTLMRVRERVRQELRGRAPTLARVARAMRMSERTLQRRLGEHHTTFHAVVEDVRRELALYHLKRSELSLGEIAFLLGYSDTRAFLRAFRRWTRTTPQRYRQEHAARQSSM
jgi:AraC-like DNA-binding protein